MQYERKLLSTLLQKKPSYKDHVGIELEIEGSSLPEVDSEYWKSERDGSLRGESFEYVLRRPIPVEETQKALAEIKGEWEEAEATIKNSPNAGTHVHVNCSDLTFTQLINYVSLYMIVEDILVDRCGIDRVGNLFCLRASDAEYLVDKIVEAVRESDIGVFHTDEIRYASINLKALGDYGSVEFRAWRADGDLEAVKWWVELLMHLKTYARNLDNPSLIVTGVSDRQPRQYFEDILGPFAKDIEWDKRFEASILASVRRVQQWAYLGDW